jgi:hypothetical protein
MKNTNTVKAIRNSQNFNTAENMPDGPWNSSGEDVCESREEARFQLTERRINTEEYRMCISEGEGDLCVQANKIDRSWKENEFEVPKAKE